MKLDDRVGLHPALKELHQLWDSGDLAVDSRGRLSEPEPLAHSARWRSGRRAWSGPHLWRAGWAGPPMRTTRSSFATSVRNRCPWLCKAGRRCPRRLPAWPTIDSPPGPFWPIRGEMAQGGDSLLNEVRRQFAASRGLSAQLAAIPADPSRRTTLASSETLEGRLETIRRLIEVDLPLRVYYTTQDGFDTHAGQRYTHQDLLRRVSQAVAGFLTSLKTSRLDERVVVLLFSEFGRRLKENASNGTDHGAAAPVLLAGKPVKGGLIGPPPNLSKLDEAGDPTFTTDFRDVYATLLGRWLAVDPEPILGRRHESIALIESR